MKQYIKKLSNNKLLTTLTIITIISLVIGIFYITILNTSSKKIITDSITNYLNQIQNNKIDLNIFIKTLNTNTITNLFIWLLGISLIGIPIILFILIFKSISLSFTFTSIIYNYSFKGIILSIIYIIPHIINLFILFYLSYYAIRFSILLFNYLFRQKNFNRKYILKKYFKLLIISLIVIVITSIIEIYIIPRIIKFLFF